MISFCQCPWIDSFHLLQSILVVDNKYNCNLFFYLKEIIELFYLFSLQIPTKPKFLDMSEEFHFSFVKCSITFIEYGFKNYCPIPANTLHNFTQLLHNLFFKSRNPKVSSLFVSSFFIHFCMFNILFSETSCITD